MKIDNYYEQQGSGSPIVFVHGSYANTSTWKKMVEHMAQTHHCISIKLPGHCGMPDPDDFSDPTLETELSIIEQVVTQLTDQPIHLIGHSYGGVIALGQALKESLQLSQLTLFEPVAVWVLDVVNDEDMSGRVQKFLTKYRHDVSQQLPYACGQVIDFWGGEGSFEPLPDFIKDGMTSLVKNNIRHWEVAVTISHSLSQLQQLSTPTRVICGSQSNPVAQAITDHLTDQIPNSKKFMIDGASHFLVTSHVDECLNALQDVSIFDS